MVKRGSTGDEVRIWQRAAGVKADGAFGPMTEAATKVLQRRFGLPETGEVDDATWRAVAGKTPAELEVVRGIDVSAIQGELTDRDWAAIKTAGVDFAWLRGVVGNEYRDARLKQNAERARRAGVVVGAYVFPFPLPHLDPRRQAEYFVQMLDGVLLAGDLPVAFDLEWPPPEEREKTTGRLVDVWKKWGCSPPQLRDWALACLARGEELTGQTWAVYTYRYWSQRTELVKSPELAIRPLWLADYAYAGRIPSPVQAHATAPTGPWGSVAAVQHDGNGGLRLPNGRDADFNVFLGGRSEFDRFRVGVTAPSCPDPAGIMVGAAAPGTIAEAEIADYRRDRIDVQA